MNKLIRNFILSTVSTNKEYDTKKLITLVVNTFGCSRQKVCGNLSYMACKEESIQMISNYPTSIVYI